MNNSNFFKDTIKEICEEQNIKYELLSRDWIFKLEKNNQNKFISGYKFDLNNHGLGLIIDDKFALYEILKKTVPIIEHNIIYSKDNKSDVASGYNDYEAVKNYFINHENNIVIKTNTGTCGKSVYRITDINEIEPILENLFVKNYSLSYCPYYNIKNEYRVVILNNKEKLIYKKMKPVVVGDGNKSIKELLIDFNSSYFFDIFSEEYDGLYDKVLNEGEVFEYNWKFNLSKGAKASLVKDSDTKNKLMNIYNNILNKIEIGFASIDIIETHDDEFYVMEVNSGVMMKNVVNHLENGEKIVKDIYKEAVLSMFESC